MVFKPGAGWKIIIDCRLDLVRFQIDATPRRRACLTQIASLLNVDCAGILVLRDGGVVGDDFSVLAGFGAAIAVSSAPPDPSRSTPTCGPMVGKPPSKTGAKHEFVDQRTVLYVSHRQRTGSGRAAAGRSASYPKTDRSLVGNFRAGRLSIAFRQCHSLSATA